MAERKPVTKGAQKPAKGFTDEERAAMRERVQEMKGKGEGEGAVLAKIRAMAAADRALGERVHAIVRANAPDLTPKLWYGMPAYANKDGRVICFFRDAAKFKTRYAMFGFEDRAHLDDGAMWPIAFALTELTPADEARIAALVKKAVS